MCMISEREVRGEVAVRGAEESRRASDIGKSFAQTPTLAHH